jgi:hypothetical protein
MDRVETGRRVRSLRKEGEKIANSNWGRMGHICGECLL